MDSGKVGVLGYQRDIKDWELWRIPEGCGTKKMMFKLRFLFNVCSSNRMHWKYSSLRVTDWSLCMVVKGGRKCRLWVYIGLLTVDCRLKEAKILMIKEAFSRESVSQGCSNWEVAEWNFLFNTGIQRGWGWFNPMYDAWWVLALKVWKLVLWRYVARFNICYGNSHWVVIGSLDFICKIGTVGLKIIHHP